MKTKNAMNLCCATTLFTTNFCVDATLFTTNMKKSKYSPKTMQKRDTRQSTGYREKSGMESIPVERVNKLWIIFSCDDDDGRVPR